MSRENEQFKGWMARLPQGTYSVLLDGEMVSVTIEELVKGYLRQVDYTKKTVALARLRAECDADHISARVEERVALERAKLLAEVEAMKRYVDDRAAVIERFFAEALRIAIASGGLTIPPLAPPTHMRLT